MSDATEATEATEAVHAIPADFQAELGNDAEAITEAAKQSPMLPQNVTSPAGLAPAQTAAEGNAPETELDADAEVEAPEGDE